MFDCVSLLVDPARLTRHSRATTQPLNATTMCSMLKMPHAGENHGQAVLVCRRNHFFITHRPAGLNDGSDAVFCGFIHAIAKRKKGVRSEYRSFNWKLRPHRANL